MSGMATSDKSASTFRKPRQLTRSWNNLPSLRESSEKTTAGIYGRIRSLVGIARLHEGECRVRPFVWRSDRFSSEGHFLSRIEFWNLALRTSSSLCRLPNSWPMTSRSCCGVPLSQNPNPIVFFCWKVLKDRWCSMAYGEPDYAEDGMDGHSSDEEAVEFEVYFCSCAIHVSWLITHRWLHSDWCEPSLDQLQRCDIILYRCFVVNATPQASLGSCRWWGNYKTNLEVHLAQMSWTCSWILQTQAVRFAA